MAQNNLSRTPLARPGPTLRLTFTYEGDHVRLTGMQRVDMIVPPSVNKQPEAGQLGFWFEVHDSKGQPLYHRVLHNPIRTDTEVFSDEPERPIYRVPRTQIKGEFTLLVPDLPDAHSLVIHGVSPSAKARFTSARELVRFTFEELRRPLSPGSDHGQSR